jgi:hypothetical protein
MRTRLTIMGIVLAAVAVVLGTIALLGALFGWPWLAICVLGAAAALVAYRLLLQHWQHRWGATDLILDAASTTRPITVAAPPEQVWPWLVQLGHGRAGWYSYDWIDNDGQPSADRILPELQQLQVGDQVLMVPEMGPRIREIQPNR